MSPPPLTTEPINDLPVLMHLLHDKLCYDKLFDQLMPRHGNWQGLSPGQVLVTWLVHILSERNHYMSPVQTWADQVSNTLAGVWGQAVRPTDLTDDRLAEIARQLSRDEIWQPLEQQVTRQQIRVYALPVERVRLDSTTVNVYGDTDAAVLFQRGYSKDHRPDLRQFKVMLAALDPLGMLVGADVVPGNAADDGLYVPLVERLRTTLPARGLLYIGDSKMGALATRAYLQASGNYYLMPLAQIGQVPEQLARWVKAAVKGRVTVQPLSAAGSRQRVGEAYELTRPVSADRENVTIRWSERVLVVRSDRFAQAAVRGLQQRLTRAQTDLRALTPARGRGQRQFTDRALLDTAVETVLTRYAVTGLIDVQIKSEVERQTVRAYAQQPARVVTQTRLVVTPRLKKASIQHQEQLLGWRVYVTNSPAKRLSLNQAVQAYRDEWLIERDCARLKGRSLSLRPIWVSREDHARGLTRLLTLAARVLALAEYQVRRKLAETHRQLAGLTPGQPTRPTDSPTTERLLKAFDHVTLTIIRKGKQIYYHVTPLSDLQRAILSDLNCPRTLYKRWLPKSWKPLRI